MSTSGSRKVGCGLYVLSALLAVIGVGAGIGGSVYMFGSLTSPSTQVIVPGKGEVNLHESGNYVICYEYRSVVNGRPFVTSQMFPGLQAKLVCKTTGENVPLTPNVGSYTYTQGNRSGAAVWQCDVKQAGVYELSTWYPQGVTGPEEVVLAVSKGFPWQGLILCFAGMGVGGLCLLAALIVFVITLIRRQRTSVIMGTDAPQV